METIIINQLCLTSESSLSGVDSVKLVQSANTSPLDDDKKAQASGGIFVVASESNDELVACVKSKLTNVLADNVKVCDSGTLCSDKKRVWLSFERVNKDSGTSTNASI